MLLAVPGRNALAALALLISLSANAGLTAVDIDGDWSNGHEGVYDDVLDITWLANANLAVTEAFGVAGVQANGTMAWDIAQTFIGAMNAEDSGAGYLGVNSWRQVSSSGCTSTSDPCDDIDDELGYHFYQNFGAEQGSPVTQGANTQSLELFGGIEVSFYWTGTETFPGAGTAWAFNTNTGNQIGNTKIAKHYVWPVAPGMVGTPQPVNVPVLPIWAFILLGLTLAGIRLRAAQT